MGKKSKKGQSRNKNRNNNAKSKSSATTTAASTAPSTKVEQAVSVADDVESVTPTELSTTDLLSFLPSGLKSSLPLFTESQQKLAISLCSPPSNQTHLFTSWSDIGSNEDTLKQQMMEQLERMDTAYPSNGLVGYIENAKRLLEDSKQGVNPLEGWSPSIPDGKCFELGSEEYKMVEEKGMGEMGKCGFVLVAGGLGERLGYSGIKLGLPTELSTETTYLQFYIETILAIQSRYASPNTKLPLCIMVSNDTIKGTIQLLKDNHNFGMDQSQITLVQQGDGVPALSNNDASFVLQSNNPYALEAKPHGHGDIHALLHSHNVVQSWEEQGLEWVIFFQDTNGLAFHTLPLALGVSKMNDFIMNSMAVPRKAKQAVGGIAKLKKVTGEERTINVEYNQLDPLLRASGYPDGDVNDPNTGFSPYPGNINQLLFQLKPYCQVLKRSKGAMPEFVNPKYADAEKTTFKKPTRLECMMQDFPTTLVDDEVKRVGFTSIGADLCFSPVKNATSDGVNLQKNGTHPGVAASGEADQYAAVRKIMKSIGCVVEEAESKSFSGIAVIPGPDVVLKPDFVLCPAEYKSKFPNPSQVKISSRSSLVIKSSGVVIESLNLDGALVVECEEGASGVVRDLVIKNQGWSKVVDESSDIPEYIRIRGYRIEKNETTHIIFKKDGTVEGLPAPPDVTVDRTLESLDVTTPVSKEESNKSQECACVIQ